MRQQLSLSSTSQDTHKSRQKHAKLNTKMNTITLIVRDDLLERSTERAKATRSGNSLKLEVQWTSNASFVSERLEREHHPTFGGFRRARRSKRGESISHLEGFEGPDAPNVGNPSRIWRVIRGLSLQTRENYLTFGGLAVGTARQIRQI